MRPGHGFLCHSPAGRSRGACEESASVTNLRNGDCRMNWYDTFFEHMPEWFVAIFTATLWLSTLGLWWATRGTLKHAKETTELLQRAYLSVEPLGVELKVSGDGVLGQVGIRNAGRLPARDVGWFVDIKQAKTGDETDFPLNDVAGSIVIAPGAMAPRGTKSAPLLQDLAEASGSDSVKGRQEESEVFLYVWGIVFYHDGFRPKRFIKFCHRYNWIARDQGGYRIDKERARYHEHGNATDEPIRDASPSLAKHVRKAADRLKRRSK
jgi:hypothetical protein